MCNCLPLLETGICSSKTTSLSVGSIFTLLEEVWYSVFFCFFCLFLLAAFCLLESCKFAKCCYIASSFLVCFWAFIRANFSFFSNHTAIVAFFNSACSSLCCCFSSCNWCFWAYISSISFAFCVWSSWAAEIFAGKKKIAAFPSFLQSSINMLGSGPLESSGTSLMCCYPWITYIHLQCATIPR